MLTIQPRQRGKWSILPAYSSSHLKKQVRKPVWLETLWGVGLGADTHTKKILSHVTSTRLTLHTHTRINTHACTHTHTLPHAHTRARARQNPGCRFGAVIDLVRRRFFCCFCDERGCGVNGPAGLDFSTRVVPADGKPLVLVGWPLGGGREDGREGPKFSANRLKMAQWTMAPVWPKGKWESPSGNRSTGEDLCAVCGWLCRDFLFAISIFFHRFQLQITEALRSLGSWIPLEPLHTLLVGIQISMLMVRD